MSYNFFQNKDCEYFPCKKTETLNCLFCFCPLYDYNDCGGAYTFTTNGIKDCSHCLLPHSVNGYDYIVKKICSKNEEKIKK